MTTTSDITLPQRTVLNSTMAYRESGDPGAPMVLFLHGNPTSSYIWRNVIPLVAPIAHCIAPDLIGFGQSGKPDIAYRFADHVRYVDAFLAESGISSAYIVAQDWGTALAFHLAACKPEFVRGLAFMVLSCCPSGTKYILPAEALLKLALMGFQLREPSNIRFLVEKMMCTKTRASD